MSKEAILKIRTTEEKAESILAEARVSAKARVEAARESGRALRETAEEDGAKALKLEQEKLQRERDEALAACEEEAKKEIADLQKEAALRKKNAERIVLRGLEDKCR